ncbi:hypothetical protein PspLS_03359 [Pyricularia sp. CBS 133598]|nr:hypothetical protein PspLS_03359 [Pyricularia sp. CBS 133598]
MKNLLGLVVRGRKEEAYGDLFATQREVLILAAEGIPSHLRIRSAWTPKQGVVEAWKPESGPITYVARWKQRPNPPHVNKV